MGEGGRGGFVGCANIAGEDVVVRGGIRIMNGMMNRNLSSSTRTSYIWLAPPFYIHTPSFAFPPYQPTSLQHPKTAPLPYLTFPSN